MMRAITRLAMVMVALAVPVQAETPGHILTEARGIAQGISEPHLRARALERVVATYTERGDFVAALEIITSEPDTSLQSELWTALAQAVAIGITARESAEGGFDVIRQIPDAYAVDVGMRYLAIANQRIGNTAGIAQARDHVSDPWLQDQVSGELVAAYIEDGQIAEARTTLSTIRDPLLRDPATVRVVQALTEQGQLSEAEALIAEIDGTLGQNRAQSAILRALAATGDWSAVDDRLAGLDGGLPTGAAAALAGAAAEQGDLARAESWLAQVTDDLALQQAELDIAHALALRDQAMAFTFVSGRDAERQSVLLGHLIGNAIAADRFDIAHAALDRITDPERRANVAALIAVDEAATNPDSAREVLATASDPGWRSLIVLALIRAGEGGELEDEMLARARAEEDPVLKVYALTDLAAAIP